mmetsp:Transcript_1241/g.1729  ORF Transcript_1241/g.1729 Transcript_1241/m.1729 type:complete len:111 (+) Transcript_1241:291-623(+)
MHELKSREVCKQEGADWAMLPPSLSTASHFALATTGSPACQQPMNVRVCISRDWEQRVGNLMYLALECPAFNLPQQQLSSHTKTFFVSGLLPHSAANFEGGFRSLSPNNK